MKIKTLDDIINEFWLLRASGFLRARAPLASVTKKTGRKCLELINKYEYKLKQRSQIASKQRTAGK